MYLEKRQSHLQFRMEGILQSFYLWKTGLSFARSTGHLLWGASTRRELESASPLQKEKWRDRVVNHRPRLLGIISHVHYILNSYFLTYQAGYFNIYVARDSSKKVSVLHRVLCCVDRSSLRRSRINY